jgi:phosphoglycolate phosphatase-like HAD superfamily hydrolase
LKYVKTPNRGFPRGRISHALFDFDGTISLIRFGWEEVMQHLMEEMIAGDRKKVTPEIKRTIQEYIDDSTGILTIYQMQWLVEAVERFGLEDAVLTAREYKRIYNERLLQAKVEGRLDQHRGRESKLILKGARFFLDLLVERDVKLLLASGTDDIYVQREAAFLKINHLFSGGIYGARDDSEEFSKENIIRRILRDRANTSEGGIVAVFGDGPVEIRAAKDHGALAVGVASDESTGAGWNVKKVRRLTNAGADIIIPDFSEGRALLELIES